jgi:hypothetical protein
MGRGSASEFAPIGSGGLIYDPLCRQPDAVHSIDVVDGVIACESPAGIDNDELVIGVHCTANLVVGRLGA